MGFIHTAVRNFFKRIDGVGHKLYMNNFFPHPDLFDDMTKKKVSSCGTVRPNRKGVAYNLLRVRPGLKMGDIRVRVIGDITVLVQRSKRDVRVLRTMSTPPAAGSFCDGMEVP